MLFRRQSLAYRGGFSLVELVGATAAVSVMIGAIGLVQMRSHDAARGRLAEQQAEVSCLRTLECVAQELERAGPGACLPDGASDVRTSTLALQLAQGETANGLDDNGDGLVDERRLVLTRGLGTAHPTTIDLCSGIPEFVADGRRGAEREKGFWIHRDGNLLTVHLTVEVSCGHGLYASSSQQRTVVLHE
jgi:type II secretory pathway pseudopilin PulG